jgi:hypothetical protein
MHILSVCRIHPVKPSASALRRFCATCCKKIKERTDETRLLRNLLKSLDSIGQGRMRTQVQELPDTCFRKTNEMQHHGQKGNLSMKTKAKQKCSPVVAQNLTMVRRSSV